MSSCMSLGNRAIWGVVALSGAVALGVALGCEDVGDRRVATTSNVYSTDINSMTTTNSAYGSSIERSDTTYTIKR